jgi:transcriptional antiterminator Rof (Rho-off)
MTYDIPGPAFKHFMTAATYSPVDCDFTDELEHLSVKKFDLVLFHFDSAGKKHESAGRIVDIHIIDKAEYVVLSSGIEVRLDYIEFVRSEYKSSYKLPHGPAKC